MTVSHRRRSNGEGSVFPTADGRIRGAITVTNPLTGALVRRYVSGRTRAEVVRRLDTLRRDAAAGALASDERTGEYTSPNVLTFSDLTAGSQHGYIYANVTNITAHTIEQSNSTAVFGVVEDRSISADHLLVRGPPEQR